MTEKPTITGIGDQHFVGSIDEAAKVLQTDDDKEHDAMLRDAICPSGGESKETNPKDALGIKKVPLHCVPCRVIMELGLAMMEGGRKYGTHNYRAMGVRHSTYYNAALRHLMADWEGEDADPDSGVPHLIKAMACLMVLRDSQLMGNYEDDRPLKHPAGLNLKELNDGAAHLIEKYPECVAPFTEENKDDH